MNMITREYVERHVPAVTLSPKLAEQVIERVLQNGGDYAELFCEVRDASAFSGDDGKVDRAVSGVQGGVGIRLDKGDRSYFAYVEFPNEDTLLKAATSLRPAEADVSVHPASLPLKLSSEHPQRPHKVTIPLDQRTKKERVRWLIEANEHARRIHPYIRHVSTYLSTVQQDVVIANSEGRFVHDCRLRVRFRVKAFAKTQSETRRSMGVWGASTSGGFEIFDSDPVPKIARRSAMQALTLLDAHEAPAGVIPVVLAEGTGGVLVHEAVGHGLEADTVLKGSSPFRESFNIEVAHPAVTIVDDATVPRALGSFAVDDEGTDGQRTVLIEHGVLKSYICDRRTATQLGMLPTGNGRRASFRHLPEPRMTNTFLLPGDHTKDEILLDTDYGIYVTSLSGGSVNPVNGSFTFTTQEAYAIRGGRISEPVRSAVIMGNVRDVLRNIDRIGNELKMWGGMCGKGGQRVWTGFGVPALRIQGMTVGGSVNRV